MEEQRQPPSASEATAAGRVRDGSINAKRAGWAAEGLDALTDRLFGGDWPSADAQMIAAALLMASADISHTIRQSAAQTERSSRDFGDGETMMSCAEIRLEREHRVLGSNGRRMVQWRALYALDALCPSRSGARGPQFRIWSPGISTNEDSDGGTGVL